MNLHFADPQLAWLFCGILGILILASVLGAILKSTVRTDSARATIANLNARTRAWWKMCAIFALTLLVGRIGSLVLFGLLSLLALREYITLVPTRRGDHRTLLWVFIIIRPDHLDDERHCIMSKLFEVGQNEIAHL